MDPRPGLWRVPSGAMNFVCQSQVDDQQRNQLQVIMNLVANELCNAEYRLKLILFMVLIVAVFNS